MSENCPGCRTFAEENGRQHLEIVGYQAEILHLVREKNALKRELANARQSEPLARDITAILKLWRALCSTKRSSIELDGDRAKVVRAALKSKVTGTPKEKRRMCMDAVRGLALRPYVVNAQRKGTGKPEQRYAKIEHALGDEGRIEDHAGFYRMAQAKPLDWKFEAYSRAGDVEAHYRDLWMSAAYDEKLKRTRDRLRADQEAVETLAAKTGFTVEQLGAAIEGRPVPSADKPRLFVVPDPESEAA